MRFENIDMPDAAAAWDICAQLCERLDRNNELLEKLLKTLDAIEERR